MAGALRRLAAVSRLILFDRRGLGSSDPLPERRLMTVEESMSDLVAVLDAAGSSRVTVVKTDNAGPALMFVTTFPERVAGLGLVNAYARLAWAQDYPAGIPEEIQAEYFMRLDTLGPEGSIEVLAASRAADPLFREWYARAMRSAASPSRVAALIRQELATDARRLLPLVQVPTLVLHSAENAYISPELSRYIADQNRRRSFRAAPGNEPHHRCHRPRRPRRRTHRVHHRRPPTTADHTGPGNGAHHRHRRVDPTGCASR